MEWYLFIAWVLCLTIFYLIFNYINKKYTIFNKIHSFIVVPLPFFILILIALPQVILDVNWTIIMWSSTIPTMIVFGWSTAIFLERFNVWRAKKASAANKANGSYKKGDKK